VEYFIEVGRNVSLPLMIYHIPGRAAVSVKLATVAAICERVPHLVGIKHADQNLELVTELLVELGSEFRIFCGLEALSLPMLVLGAAGLMNAVGNIAPKRVAALYDSVQRGDLKRAREIHTELLQLNQSIFLDTNPIPLKYMMKALGMLDSAEVRLPLAALEAAQERTLDGVLARAGMSAPSVAAAS
jgi:4-hydroxy-tetrahydrodipicolinate synthase